MDDHTKVKLRFCSTDLLRLTHVNMRICQCTLHEYGKDCGDELLRTEPNAYELLMATQMWLRQFHIHSAFYRWFKSIKRETRDGQRHLLGGLLAKAEEPESLNKQKNNLDDLCSSRV